ncbi:TPA: hypothetical protein SAY52_005804 [Burkholderia cenocepacia]|uniref:hypothetical protein n=1 Tax=unclassified Burkholderia TaxID=2613784 RepID=UPI00158EF676|nr:MULTISPECIES: hypothetical protein [unclassified Burkholderia]HEF5875112.1 hypothetical protein [Burkholderia cenocepacia]
MTPSDRLSLATRIAELRALQLSRERVAARKLTAARHAACLLERDTASRLEALVQSGRSDATSAALSSGLLLNLAGAVDAMRATWLTAAEHACSAAEQVDTHRSALERQQQCADAADALVSAARAAARRARAKANDAQLEAWLSTRRRIA